MAAPSNIIVFAKPPVPGRVKTRLLPRLAPEAAAQAHLACLRDTMRMISQLPGCRKWLRVAGGAAHANQLAQSLELGPGWRVDVQRGRGLGERLENAFAAAFRLGAGKIVTVGSDTPWMGTRRIRQALALLDHTDVVLGPSADGGYYLVGARKNIPSLFRGIPWSTADVLRATRVALERAHVSYRLLPRDFDLDRPEDLDRAAALLVRNAAPAPRLAQFLKKTGEKPVNRSSRRPAPGRRSRKPRPGRA